MTTPPTTCPVCDRAPRLPAACAYRVFWADGTVFRPYSDEERTANAQALDDARAEMRRQGEALPVSYAVAVAAQGSDVAAVPLFERGTVGPWAPRAVHLDAAPGATETLLPIVALTDDDPATWKLIDLFRARVLDGGSVDVQVELTGPGDLTVTGPRVERLEGGPAWPQIREWAAQPPPPPTDLVCVVDLTGTAEEFAARTERLRNLLTHLDLGNRGRPATQACQVALFGCLDHAGPGGADHPLEQQRLGTPRAALAALARWTRAERRNDLGAPIEDALHALGTLAWRPGSSRGLLTLGSRAPHPPTQQAEAYRNCCPQKLDWEELLFAAQVEHDLRCVAVRWPAAENPLLRLAIPRDAAWDALGSGDPLRPTEATPSEIARRLDVTPRPPSLAVGASSVARTG